MSGELGSGLASTYALLGVSAGALGLILTPVVRALAIRVGAVDEPGGRRVHERSIPRLGGVAVLIASLAALGLAGLFDAGALVPLSVAGSGVAWLLAGTLIVTSIGIIDDFRGVGPLPKLAVEVAAAGMALAGGYGFRAVTNPITGGAIDFGPFGNVITVLWVVGITNAFNLIDGLDGLAAGVALIVSGTIFVVSLSQGRADAALLCATLGGALVGFLYFNFHPASVFLGDSGSLLLGYTLSILSIQGLGKGPTAVVILVPVLALGFPIMDTLVTVLRRFRQAGSAGILQADSEHIHHRLVMMGMSQRRAVLLLYGVCSTFALLALLAVVISGPGSTILIAVVVITSYLALRKLGYAIQVNRVGGGRILIYGADEQGAALLRRFRQDTTLAPLVMGFVDDRPECWGQTLDGLEIVGGGSQLAQILRRHNVEQVWVASRDVTPQRLAELTALCRASGAALRQGAAAPR
jgi:UDP-GlcNAc:undecaprenyl-phosphate/decaprenyl-phosphate GlcNAc-1-phosphate transferase